jgi:hypothetical protein
MNTNSSLRSVAIILFAAVCLPGCTLPATPAPTSTPTAAFTATVSPTALKGGVTVINNPTSTRRPKIASSPIKTRTQSRTVGSCGITNSEWGSEEVVETTWTTTPFPMVQFHVGNCQVSRFTLVVYPAKGHLFEAELTTTHGLIQPDGSISVSFDNPDGAGALSIAGNFTSPDFFQGFLMFSEGFQIGDYPLPNVVKVPFSARLAQQND